MTSSLAAFDLRAACVGIVGAIRSPQIRPLWIDDECYFGSERSDAPTRQDIERQSLEAYSQLSLQVQPSPLLNILEQWASASQPSSSQDELLEALAKLLLSPHIVNTSVLACAIAEHAQPLIVDLCARLFDSIRQQRMQDRHENCDVIDSNGLVASLYISAIFLPHIPALYPLLCDLLEWWSASRQGDSPCDMEHAPTVFVSLYRIVSASPAIIDDAPLPFSCNELRSIALSKEQDGLSPMARLMALRVYTIVDNLTEAAATHLQRSFFGTAPLVMQAQEMACRVLALKLAPPDSRQDVVIEEVDPWLIPIDEAERRSKAQSGKRALEKLETSSDSIKFEHLSPNTTVFGNHVFYTPFEREQHDKFRETAHCKDAIARMGHLLANSMPILLTGPEASGKTALIRHACRHFRPAEERAPIVTLQLGDHSGIDAKSLIGSYISSTKQPGTFEWVEGALARALRLGKWLVLKDIDRASGEILSVIKPLVEDLGPFKAIGTRPRLDLGGNRGYIVAKRGFALFATRTIRKARQAVHFPQPTFLGWSHWSEAQLGILGVQDVYEIIASKSPVLSKAGDDTIQRLVTTWLRLIEVSGNRTSAPEHSTDQAATGSQRSPSLHDLLKWCRRLEASILRDVNASSTLASAPMSNQALQEEAALEACDLFLGGMAPAVSVHNKHAEQGDAKARLSRYEAMLNTIADGVGVQTTMLWHAVRDRKPEMRIQSASSEDGSKIVRVGRAHVSRSRYTLPGVKSPAKTFALTAPASRLLERIAVCVAENEPTLIVGETGTGKTTIVQQLASFANKPLIALNLSQQTETGDLLGGFKPVDPKLPATDLHNIWVELFQRTFSSRRNARYMQAERKVLQSGKWARLHKLWGESVDMANRRFSGDAAMAPDENVIDEERRAIKTRRLDTEGSRSPAVNGEAGSKEHSLATTGNLKEEWKRFSQLLDQFGVQFTQNKRNVVFSFIEGPLIQAIQSGAWVLLDEINLASAETLESLSALLQTPDSSLTLSERGDLEPVPRHQDFRLFACMNPATDVGKKDLPDSLRSRLTELYAPSPDSDRDALVGIVEKYISSEALGDRAIIMDVADAFVSIKRLAREHRLADGANQRPHYSVRTLARALVFGKDTFSTYGLRRALYEGFLMAFTMLLEKESAGLVRDILMEGILKRSKNVNSIVNIVPPMPKGGSCIQIGAFWLEPGPNPLDDAQDYILTPSVQDKLIGLARTALTRRSPVLIQGPTSAGKTSAIEYLARRTGHTFVRINNHEHTDLQEYLGSYATDPETGRLTFAEGLLVKAARQGHWIVLDELNLAPTDVLEALNRLLDDNRELIIPETNEIVRPHPHFMLYATQNPPGLYAGRKVLSRAFRNRFLEIHFDDVPQNELQTILSKRCRIAPSYAERIVRVFVELQRRRQTTRVFDTKQAFATLRDLFRWGMRQAHSYDELALNGYMLIAERARRAEDADVVKQVIEDILKVKIDTTGLYDIFDEKQMALLLGSRLAEALRSSVNGFGIVWTSAMRRLVCLVACALRYGEPVLLVGETGTGKTTVCQLLAKAFGRPLLAVNCHQNTDASDLLGGQRPLRDRESLRQEARMRGSEILHKFHISHEEGSGLYEIERMLTNITLASDGDRREIDSVKALITQSSSLFEWHDGPMVQAMQKGTHFLLDEISLADDSVLERLNSVLEPERILVLAERSTIDAADSLKIQAHPEFQIIATMNPGGDYGKKELSPALRNRFTEVWVPQVTSKRDLAAIVDAQWSDASFKQWSEKMVEFAALFSEAIGGDASSSNVGLRDLISWAHFMKSVIEPDSREMVISHRMTHLPASAAYAHGAYMNYIDGIPLHPLMVSRSDRQVKFVIDTLIEKIASQTQSSFEEIKNLARSSVDIVENQKSISIGSFRVAKGHLSSSTISSTFDMNAQTPLMNALRVFRALQVSERAVMLEGSPGAGKTSLIVALARACHCRLTRINLSDQTELSDLFGADLPIEGGQAGQFAWRDAAFLKAMQDGDWVLLDEMNLASQSVLEGLNSCLDHRGQIYIPELDRTFRKHPNFRFFAAQNPQIQGGGRKGLPKSFLNRFTKVFIKDLNDDDFLSIMTSRNSSLPRKNVELIVEFNHKLQESLRNSALSRQGRPWEFNLRDLLRWLDLIETRLGAEVIDKGTDPLEYFASLYTMRFRTKADRDHIASLCRSIFKRDISTDAAAWLVTTPANWQVGHVLFKRKLIMQRRISQTSSRRIPRVHHGAAQALAEAIKLSWPAIIVGRHATGKTGLVRKFAQHSGYFLHEMRLNSGTDASDLIGGFEQNDIFAEVRDILNDAAAILTIFKSKAMTSVQLHHENHLPEIGLISNKVHDLIHIATTHILELAEVQRTLGELESIHQAFGFASGEVGDLRSRLRGVQQEHEKQTSSSFKWKDGPFLRAMRQGDWILLDDANLCNSSVLDRLNPVLEPNGRLLLSERGSLYEEKLACGETIETVVPHPDFRVFFALDPKYGELSRAMRNRGVEVCIGVDHDAFPDNGLIDEWSLNPQEGSLSNLVCWQSALLVSKYFLPVQRLAVRTSNQDSMHLFAPKMRPILATLETQSPLQQSTSLIKTAYSSANDIDLLFLIELGPDLQADETFFTSKEDAPTNLFSLALGLYSLVHQQELLLRRLVTDSHRDLLGDRRSVLQKSILNHLGEDDHSLDQRDAFAFPLVKLCTGVAQTVSSAMLCDLGIVITCAQLLQRLSDRLGYIVRFWSRSSEIDASRTKVVISDLTAIAEELLKHAPPFCSDNIQDLLTALRQIDRHFHHGGGQAMSQIWEVFLHQNLRFDRADIRNRLIQAVRQKRISAPPALIATALDIYATFSHEQFRSQENFESLNELAQRTLINLDAVQDVPGLKTSMGMDCDESVLSCLLLSFEQSRADVSNHSITSALPLTLIASKCLHFPASSIVQFKNLQYNASSRSSLADGSFAWTHCLFKTQDTSHDWTPNACDFFGPLLLDSATVCASSPATAALGDMEVVKSNIQRKLDLTYALSWLHRDPRALSGIKKGLTVALAVLPAVLHALESEGLSAAVSAKLLSDISASNDQERADASHLVAEICRGTESASNPLTKHLFSFLSEVSQLQGVLKRGQSLTDQGSSLFTMAWHLINFYVPASPLDPLVLKEATREIREHSKGRIRDDLESWSHYAFAFAGASQTQWASALQQDLLNLGTDERPDDKRVLDPQRTTSLARLRSLHGEMLNFARQVIPEKRVESILSAKSSAQLEDLESTIASVQGRLASLYSDAQDLFAPFCAALSLMHLSIGMLLRMNKLRSRSHRARCLEMITTALTTEPPALSAALMQCSEVPVDSDSLSPQTAFLVKSLLAKLQSIAYDIGCGFDKAEFAQDIEQLYHQLWFLWSKDEEERQKQRREEASLYRTRKLDVEVKDDEELQEQEFASLFPTYVDVLEEQEDQEESREHKAASQTFFSSQDLNLFYETHSSIFADCSFPPGGSTVASGFPYSCSSFVSEILRTSKHHFSESIDLSSSAHRIKLLAQAHLTIRGDSSLDRDPDFYRDPDPPEASKLAKIVRRLIFRLEELIMSFPDQFVLLHIKQRSEAILKMTVTSPVNRLLSALEALLQHTEDWQAFASSRTSLQNFRDEMIALIIEWRRKELNNWKTLLQREEQRSADAAGDWFMTLLQATIKTSLGERARVQELVVLLDQFMRGSPIGQYRARLKLIASLSLYAHLSHAEKVTVPGNDVSIANIFRNSVTFFAQFADAIQQSYDIRKASIEKEVADFVKLASWKDTNVHALKTSAVKTHRKLHKSIRRLKSVLSEGVDPLLAGKMGSKTPLASFDVSIADQKTIELPELPSLSSALQIWHSGTNVSAHLTQLETTARVLARRVNGPIRVILGDDSVGLLVHSLVDEVLQRSAGLARETPSILSNSNEKLVKSLETRKRKAWSELLKELRRIGLSASTYDGITSADTAEAAYTLAIPALPQHFQISSVQEAQVLHNRVFASLPILRKTIASQERNADVGVAELQRAELSASNLFTSSVALQRRMCDMSHATSWLQGVCGRLQALSAEDSKISLLAESYALSLESTVVVHAWSRLKNVVTEIIEKVHDYSGISVIEAGPIEEQIARLKSCLAQIAKVNGTLLDIRSASQYVSAQMVREDEYFVLCHAAEWLDETIASVHDASAVSPAFFTLCSPLLDWLRDNQYSLRSVVPPHRNDTGTSLPSAHALGTHSDKVISGILVVAQEISALHYGKTEEHELVDRAVPVEVQRVVTLLRMLHIEDIFGLLKECLSPREPIAMAASDVKLALGRLSPFASAYLDTLCLLLQRASLSRLSCLELASAVCDLTSTLASKGYCRPRAAEESQSDGAEKGEGEELEGGVGLGEGEGAKDVTDTLRDDEEMEELQGESKRDDETEGPRAEKNARDTQQDFSGEENDLSRDEEESNADQDESDEQEPEEAVGDVDHLDLDAVDEKTWADEEKKDEVGQDSSKDEASQQKEGNQGSDETKKDDGQEKENRDESGEAAAERNDDTARPKDLEEAEADSGINDLEAQEEEQEEENEKNDDAADEGTEATMGRAIDEQAREAENLDLDDDMKMDEAKEGADAGDSDSDFDLDMSGDDEGSKLAENDIQDLDTDESDRNDLSDKPLTCEDANEDEIVSQGDAEKSSVAEDFEDGESVDEDVHGDHAEHRDNFDDASSDLFQAAKSTALEDGAPESGEAGNENAQGHESLGAQSGQQSGPERKEQLKSDVNNTDRTDLHDADKPLDDVDGTGHENGRQDDGEDSRAPASDPQAKDSSRTLGEALKQFRRDLDAIEEALSQHENREGAGPQQDEQCEAVEHVTGEDDTEMQAIGAATEEDAKLGTHDTLISEHDDSNVDDAGRPEVPSLENETTQSEDIDDQLQMLQGTDGGEGLDNGRTRTDDLSHSDEASTLGDDASTTLSKERQTSMPLEDDVVRILHQMEDAQEDARLEIAHQLWQIFSSTTSDHAYSLSEQLRLILSPTKATRLTGDFRTGKRLNMRKMIPFVASDYVKDKIWLRRHLPHKREYQILLCIDDSKSMSESDNRMLAFKSLALVCNALDRLEVGQVGLMKFGKDAELLKGFDDSGMNTVSDNEGAQMLANLPFDQRGTNVLRLMQKSFQVLTEAREAHSQGSNNQQLWQLQLIISDGICQDHDGLRAMLRRAEEARIMVVFVILDSLRQPRKESNGENKHEKAHRLGGAQQGNSILTMSSVEYKADASGRMQLQMRRYLDSFPFEYFVLVQDIADLPEILSTTLRQWAQRIAEA